MLKYIRTNLWLIFSDCPQICVYVYQPSWVYHVHAGALKGNKRAAECLELELWVCEPPCALNLKLVLCDTFAIFLHLNI